MAQGLDETYDRQDAGEHVALGDEGGQAGGGDGLAEVDQVVVQHGGEQLHGEQGQAVQDDGAAGYLFCGLISCGSFFHFSIKIPAWKI